MQAPHRARTITTETTGGHMDYCGCCGGNAAGPPKGEHSACCADQHDSEEN